MRPGKLLLSSLLLASLAGPSALAGVEGTHHDMGMMTGDRNQNACSYCHLPHDAGSDAGLFAQAGAAVTQLGRIGSFCYSCHDGTASPFAVIMAPDGTIGLNVLLRSHGVDTSALKAKSGGLETTSNLKMSGLLKLDVSTGDPQEMDCISCHDVHNNTYPPFLREPMENLCAKCHSGSDMLGKGRHTTVTDKGEKNGAHPVNMPYGESGYDKARGLASELTFRDPDPAFDVPALSAFDLGSPDNHWETGGHLFGESRLVTCSTCHSAHMPAPGLLVAANAPEPDKLVCSGCHGSEGRPVNPGATEGYHPVFEESLPPDRHEHANDPPALGAPREGYIELFVKIPKEFPLREDGSLTCRSCHMVHRGVEGKKCLRPGEGKWVAGVICTQCHQTEKEPDRPNMHHPQGTFNYTEYNFPPLTAWAWGPGLPGDLTDGLQCVDCHVEWARSAHNW